MTFGNKEAAMMLAELLQDIHACKDEMLKYERKYNILSATFYAAYSSGEEPPDPISMLDWIGWAGIYQIWMSRQEEYQAAITALQQQMSLQQIIEKSWRRKPLVIPA
jgi:hypothetical protein